MKLSVYPPKVVPPSAEGLMTRPRLFDAVDGALEKGHLWVSAPAGSGKTSMASSYVEAGTKPSVWYQMDAGDADPGAFFYYLGLAAKRTVSTRKKQLPLLTPEYLADVPTFTRRFFEQFFGRLASAAVVIFDNYHELPPASSLHELFSIAFAACPEGARIIVLSREEPPPSLARLIVEGKLHVMGWDELRLTRSEATRMLKLHKKGAAAAGRLHSVTEGWVAGLRFLIDRLDRQDGSAGLPDYTQLFNYFAHEVVAGLDPGTRTFLFKTAFLPVVTPPMAGRLTGMTGAGRILGELHRRNCFIEKVGTRKRAYRYHPLFRKFLLASAEEQYPQVQCREMIRTAAGLLAEAGQVEDAASLYIESGDGEKIGALALANAQALAAQGRLSTLERWLKAVAPDMKESVPWFAFWAGVCRLAHSPSQARPLLEKAFLRFESAGDTVGTLTAWSAVVDTFIHECNDYTPLDFWINWLDKRMRERLVFPSPEIEAHVATSMAGALIWRRPDRPDMKHWVERGMALSGMLPHEGLKVQACLNAGIYYLWFDERNKAYIVMEEIEKAVNSCNKAPIWAVALKCFEAMMHMTYTGTCDRAVNAVREGLSLARRTGMRVWEIHIYAPGFFASLEMGELATADDFLTRMKAADTGVQRNVTASCHHMSAWYHFLRGDLSLAAVHAESAVEMTIATGTPFPQLISHHVAVLIFRAMGECDKADEHLRAAKALLSKIKSPHMKYIVLLTEAELALEDGREEAGIELLREAMTIGRRQGYLTTLHQWRPGVMSRLCAEALAHGIETGYVGRLITELRLLPVERARHLEEWPWPLKAYTLGGFGVEKDGKFIRFNGKVPRKPLDLLKALIALGGSDIHENLVSESLWPDADGDLAGHSLKTNLHRLRKLLGREDAVIIKGCHLSLNPDLFWTDVRALERLTDRADAAWTSGDAAGAAGLYGRAVALYRGHFLPHDPAPLAISLRDRLKNRFVRSVNRRGQYLEEGGSLEPALELYQTGIELDELGEDFRMGLIRCLHGLGRRTEAVRTYHRFREILDCQLGIEPSERMKELFKSISS